jgi:glycerophosphoryl diester phosphodiesterase
MRRVALFLAALGLAACAHEGRAPATQTAVALGPRPFFLVDDMDPGPLKERLQQCAGGPFAKSDFSIAHRGAPLQFPEHTRESYLAAARMGAGIVECDVAFTRDRELVCRHAQCDLHTTTNILETPLAAKCSVPFTPFDPNDIDPQTGRPYPARAQCCTSDLTLAEFRTLRGKMDAFDPAARTAEEYLGGTPGWRTDLYASRGTLMTHRESVDLFRELGVKMIPELKEPEVPMPFEGEYAREDYAQQLVGDYVAAGIPPENVFLQSFDLADVRYWIANEPAFGRQAVYLDGRYGGPDAIDPNDPATFLPSMQTLAAEGVRFIAPPIWMLVTERGGRIVPSAYAAEASAAGLEIIAWSFERSAPLAEDGDWFYQSIDRAVDNDGDAYTVLDVLAREVGVVGVFSDWPATTTYYANCMGL